MSRILADKVTNYNNDGPFEAEKGINIPLARPLQISGDSGTSGQYLVSTGVGLTWETFPELFSGDYSDLTNKPILFSGNYNDLINKPAILDLNLGFPQSNQYIKFDGSKWINSDLPPIYEYTVSTSYNALTQEVGIILSDQFFERTSYSIYGDNGITVSTDVNGDVVITAPSVNEYDRDIAKDDISSMFLDGTNVGISYTYNPITKTIDSNVTLAEQLVYTLDGSSSATNSATISLNNGIENNGSINIVGTSGIEISWNVGTSTIEFSKTDPDLYELPPATTTTLGGVIPNPTDFNIDGLGNLTVNFPESGISLTDLSVTTEASPFGNGDLSYDNSSGQFTYTPPLFSLNDLSDVGLTTPFENQVLQYNGVNWQNSDISVPNNLDDLLDVNVSNAVIGQYLYYNGVTWQSSDVDISIKSIHELSDVSGRINDDPNQMLLWDGSSWSSTIAKLENFDVSAQAIDGQILVWNGTNNIWDPTTIEASQVSSLDDLSDVSSSGAIQGDILVYTGSEWNPVPYTSPPENLSDLLDVSPTVPSEGYVLTWNSFSSQWQPSAAGASPGAGLTTRNVYANTTSIITDGEEDTITINGYKSYMLMKIETSAAAWVTLYCDDASRTADTSRPETTDPTPGSGVIAEVITTEAETVLMTPGVMGFNNDTTPSAAIYAKVVNKSGTTQAITVTLTLLQLEA
jgi:hypothetical protein